jgi:hypothetical protein
MSFLDQKHPKKEQFQTISIVENLPQLLKSSRNNLLIYS